MIIENRLITHNDKPTFFRLGLTSCIDHIMTDCLDKITDVTTHNDYDNDNYDNYDKYDNYDTTKTKTNLCISDHLILSLNYDSIFF